MGVSGRAPRNVRSKYASSNAPDANTVRREGETDAVVPAPAGGTAEPSGDRRRGDGAITKRRRVGTENANDDPEPKLGCGRCRHSQKGCGRCRSNHAKWAARNGAAGDGIEPERAPSGADDDRDEERESQRGDADAAHDAVDGGDGGVVAVADAAVADAGVSRAVPAQLPDRPRMYGKGAYKLLPMLRDSLRLEQARQLLVAEGLNVQSVAEEIDVRKLFADVPGVDVEGRGFSKNVNNALRILAQEYGIALAVGTDAYDPRRPGPLHLHRRGLAPAAAAAAARCARARAVTVALSTAHRGNCEKGSGRSSTRLGMLGTTWRTSRLWRRKNSQASSLDACGPRRRDAKRRCWSPWSTFRCS
jgi:hypothetical protein